MSMAWEHDVKVESNCFLGTTGGELWPAATRLIKYFEAVHDQMGLDDPGVRVLELGAGLGALGLTLARNLPRAAEVCLTEQSEGGALAWLRHNVEVNGHLPYMGRATTRECDWNHYQTQQQQADQSQEQAQDQQQQQQQKGGAAGCGACTTGASAQATSSSSCTAPVAQSGAAEPDDSSAVSTSLRDKEELLQTRWDFIVGSDLIYNEVGSRMLPQVLKALATPRHTQIYYCHSKHRFDNLDLEFFEHLALNGLQWEEVREPGVPTPPPSPPPLTELFPDLRIAVFKITRS